MFNSLKSLSDSLVDRLADPFNVAQSTSSASKMREQASCVADSAENSLKVGETPRDHLSSLPFELLLKIFHLARCTQALSHYLLPLSQEMLYETVHIDQYESLSLLMSTLRAKPELGALVRMMDIAPFYVELEGDEMKIIQDSTPAPSQRMLGTFFATLVHLKSLSLRSGVLASYVLSSGAQTDFPELETFTVAPCLPMGAQGFNPSKYSMLNHFPALRNLTVHACATTSDDSSIWPEEDFQPLIQSALDSCSNYNIESLDVICPLDFEGQATYFLSHFRRLKYLTLQSCQPLEFGSANLTASVLDGIPTSLKSLSINYMEYQPPPSRVYGYLGRLKNLKRLHLGGTPLSSQLCDDLRTHKHLAHLQISAFPMNFTFDTVVDFLHGPRKLKALHWLQVIVSEGVVGDPITTSAQAQEVEDADGTYGRSLPMWSLNFGAFEAEALLRIAKRENVVMHPGLKRAIDIQKDWVKARATTRLRSEDRGTEKETRIVEDLIKTFENEVERILKNVYGRSHSVVAEQ